MARRVRLVAVALALLMLTGCLTASVAISIEPNPIKFKFNETEADITVKFTTKGFLNLKLDEMLVQLFENEDDEEPLWEDTFAIDFSSAVVVPGVEHTEEATVQLPAELVELNEDLYNENLKGKEYTLVITVTGGKTVTDKVKVVFE